MTPTAPRCSHRRRRIGAACLPCSAAYWSQVLPVGTAVAYDDEPLPVPDDLAGVIAEPTAAELRHAGTHSDPFGPHAGDVLVQWADDPWDRCWVDPRDLQVVPSTAAVELEPGRGARP